MKLNLKIGQYPDTFKLTTPDGEEISGIDHIDLRTTESGFHQAVVYFYLDGGDMQLSGIQCSSMKDDV